MHAPTPYRQQPYVDGIDILDADNVPVAHLADRMLGDMGIPPANAEFIVRACNCHDELVAALRAMCDMGLRIVPSRGEYSQAKAALAKALGPQPAAK